MAEIVPFPRRSRGSSDEYAERAANPPFEQDDGIEFGEPEA